jgi:alpha-L-rhamnosidase
MIWKNNISYISLSGWQFLLQCQYKYLIMLVPFPVIIQKTFFTAGSLLRSALKADTSLSAFSILILISSLAAGCHKFPESDLKFEKMLVEYAENPLSIDMAHPRFSWIISSAGRNRRQVAFRITVSSSLGNLKRGKPDLWDSGRIESGETIQHEYLPGNLVSDNNYFWKVYAWDSEGIMHESPPAEFGTAFLPGYKWKAKWIGNMTAGQPIPPIGFYKSVKEQQGGDTVNHDGCSLLLRNEEDISGEIESVRAYVTGLGYYEFFINGKRVGDHVLSPAKTPYHKYVLYDAYDVTSLIRQGRNAFGIHLGNGWFNPYKKWWNEYRMQWFGSKRAIAEIHIKFKNGSEKIIGTDGSWKWEHGPVIYNCVYDGEIYNSNLESDGWTDPGFDDSPWRPVTSYDSYAPRLSASRMPPVRIKEVFRPREIKVSGDGVRIFDMGQNFAGWVMIEAKGAKSTVMRLRFSEDLNPDSTLDVTSNEYANASAEYIMKSSQPEFYEPAFTYFGFRYAEVRGLNGPIDIMSIEGKAVYSDNRVAGRFNCSNSLVNKIHSATVWSQKSNMPGYPSDCPQRDERLGWLGDAQVTAEEAMFNFDMALFYENWLEGIRENQDEKSGDIPIISPRPYIKDDGIEWSSTYIAMLWQFYRFYGDAGILSHNYRAMKRYMNYLDSLSKDKILPKGWIGDWGSMVSGWKEGEPASVPTAFYYMNAGIMSDVANILEITSDRDHFKNLALDIREKYNKTFLDTLTANYSDGSQMANSFPLYLGLVPENMKSRVLANLVNDIVEKHHNHVTTGVLGTKYMPEALAIEGRADVAWSIINQKSPPCWNDMMQKYNTMCEFWTLKQSKNHVMMGSIDAWFYKYLAGIQQEESGTAFSSFRIKPVIQDSLNSAEATVETLRGKIYSKWKLDSEKFSLIVEIPFNTTAVVYVPGSADEKIKESGKPLGESTGTKYQGYDRGYHKIEVNSGNYNFTSLRKH